MYADEDEGQMTLEAYATSTPELAREAARKHRELSDGFDRAGVAVSGLEQAFYDGQTVDIREWFGLSTEEQSELLDARLERLKDDLEADLEAEPDPEPEPLTPTDYRGRRPETDVTGREFR